MSKKHSPKKKGKKKQVNKRKKYARCPSDYINMEATSNPCMSPGEPITANV